uniref:Trefoil factor 3 n=1 Tax=Molossus molossus TaxID=27622 RepID=A0A7J8I3T3_MOLMO|nr:trefoil factor 3 [Molossus molossus]
MGPGGAHGCSPPRWGLGTSPVTWGRMQQKIVTLEPVLLVCILKPRPLPPDSLGGEFLPPGVPPAHLCFSIVLLLARLWLEANVRGLMS